ncbi:MAG: hypothetical protein FH761_17955 [Firmicutes bacterium]|nr:hypothetical protein [Bacillota bacterium]
MRVINKEIDMISIFDKEGNPKPFKFKYINVDGEEIKIKVDHMIASEKGKLLGQPVIIFQCQSVINNLLKRYELLFDINKAQWRLFKI